MKTPYSVIGIIPARAGSQRVPNKNKIEVLGHPLFAYSLASASQSEIFSKIIVTSDDPEILEMGIYYGADEVIERTRADATSTSLDIDWLKNLHQNGKIDSDFFAILRPTSPQRTPALIRACFSELLKSDCDSIRTVAKVQEHPGKMWRLDSNHVATSYLKQIDSTPATHALQYSSLETLFVQTSVLEIARSGVISETNTREGDRILGYITEGSDSLAIDTLDDLDYFNFLLHKDISLLPSIKIKSFWS